MKAYVWKCPKKDLIILADDVNQARGFLTKNMNPDTNEYVQVRSKDPDFVEDFGGSSHHGMVGGFSEGVFSYE